jgi:hypothetical protein
MAEVNPRFQQAFHGNYCQSILLTEFFVLKNSHLPCISPVFGRSSSLTGGKSVKRKLKAKAQALLTVYTDT